MISAWMWELSRDTRTWDRVYANLFFVGGKFQYGWIRGATSKPIRFFTGYFFDY